MFLFIFERVEIWEGEKLDKDLIYICFLLSWLKLLLSLFLLQAYLSEDIRRELGLHREELVALAYFLGCDYADGVTGVGIVNALEIVQAFPIDRKSVV